MATAKNTRTGKIVSVPDHYVGHPVLGIDLIAVDDEVQAAPNKKMKTKEQPAPEAKSFWTKPETNIEDEEIEDGN